ncbi:MAG: ATP-binding protein, partial [Nitrosopumilus sp.]
MICDRCENQAVYTRKYSGQKLCSQCFSNSIVRKTAKTISKYNMIKNDELVAVAVSGGKDSLALLKIIHEMTLTHNFRIKVITIDEGIPGYRDEALEIVKKFCGELNVEHKVYSYKDLFELTLDEA